MKILKTLLIAILAVSITACDKDDEIVNSVYDNVNGQNGIGFTVSSASAVVRAEGTSITLPIQSTTISSQERTFTVSANIEASTGQASDYTIGTATIPADSYDGSVNIDFVDTNLQDFISYTLVVNIEAPAGDAIVGSQSVSISYNKYIICNDLELEILADNYASETTWEVRDADGTVVVSGGPYTDGTAGTVYTANFNLADGCYTFEIFDSFGDGLFDGANTGNYSLSCSIISHASGEGNFGASQATEFCVNP